MPFYRSDPSRNIMPEGMHRILAAMGLTNPRSAMPGPAMTVGPRAIPLDQPQQYIRNVLGETIGDMATHADDFSVGPVLNRAKGAVGQEAAAIRSWLDPRLAQNAREGFKIPIGDDAATQEMSAAFEDRLATWLANLFYGSK